MRMCECVGGHDGVVDTTSYHRLPTITLAALQLGQVNLPLLFCATSSTDQLPSVLFLQGRNSGINFALPVSLLRDVVLKLIVYGNPMGKRV